MKAINIMWDVDNKKDLDFLPNEIEIPDYLNHDEGYEEEISDYITDYTGFCHFGFELID